MDTICRLKDIYKALYNFEKDFVDANGITINEGMILCCMKDGKPKSANEICGFVGLSNSRVSRIINTVEAKGYISREMGAADKRQMIFTLTDIGNEKIRDLESEKLDTKYLKTELTKLIL